MLEFFDGMNRWERTAELIQIIIWLPANGRLMTPSGVWRDAGLSAGCNPY